VRNPFRLELLGAGRLFQIPTSLALALTLMRWALGSSRARIAAGRAWSSAYSLLQLPTLLFMLI